MRRFFIYIQYQSHNLYFQQNLVVFIKTTLILFISLDGIKLLI